MPDVVYHVAAAVVCLCLAIAAMAALAVAVYLRETDMGWSSEDPKADLHSPARRRRLKQLQLRFRASRLL